jgi:hypothetical protein
MDALIHRIVGSRFYCQIPVPFHFNIDVLQDLPDQWASVTKTTSRTWPPHIGQSRRKTS